MEVEPKSDNVDIIFIYVSESLPHLTIMSFRGGGAEEQKRQRKTSIGRRGDTATHRRRDVTII